MTNPMRTCCTLVAALALIGPGQRVTGAQQCEDADRRPSLSLRATPAFGASPLRVRATIEIRGGSDDYQDFYCPAIEWDWGDGTTSESDADCAPYEAGKGSSIAFIHQDLGLIDWGALEHQAQESLRLVR